MTNLEYVICFAKDKAQLSWIGDKHREYILKMVYEILSCEELEIILEHPVIKQVQSVREELDRVINNKK